MEVLDSDALTAPLIAQGLLNRNPEPYQPQVKAEEPRCSITADDRFQGVVVGPWRTLRFIRSAGYAALSLRLLSLWTVATRLGASQRRLRHQATPSHEALRHAVGAYTALRPLVFTAQDRCLHDSLALMHFLAGEQIAATWVLGVATGPFCAHAWVQRAGVVLNDQHEHVLRYEPILTV